MTRAAIAVLAATLSLACASRPVRTSDAPPEIAALADVAGVHVAASAAEPAGDAMRVWLSLDNGSGRSLRVSYRDLHLEAGGGVDYAAIAPEGSGRAFVSPPDDVAIADVPSELPQAYVFLPSLSYDLRHAPSIEFPERGATARALPEGSLRDGASLSGFVEFDTSLAGASGAVLVMNLADADKGTLLGQVRIALIGSH